VIIAEPCDYETIRIEMMGHMEVLSLSFPWYEHEERRDVRDVMYS